MKTVNPVREIVRKVAPLTRYVSTDQEKLKELAVKFSKEKLVLPKWDAPVFPDTRDEDTIIDFFMLGNCINFAFTSFDTGIKYETAYKGVMWSGAFGMWASLKRALEEGKDILDGGYLSRLKKKDVECIFAGDTPMPMIKERLEILNDVGDVLQQKYKGSFHVLFEEAEHRLFDDGNGIVERLVKDFPSFDDRALYRGYEVPFNKRAQLGVGMIYGKCLGQGNEIFPDKDMELLTVFADYELPNVYHNTGATKWHKKLEEKVRNGVLLPEHSYGWTEMRIRTVYDSGCVKDIINELRPDEKISELHIDYRLWNEGRQYKNIKHPLVKTIAC